MRKTVIMLICACIVALCLSLSGCNIVSSVYGDTYDRADEYLCGDFEYSSSDVKRIEINWFVGNVELIYSENSVLKCSEASDGLEENKTVHHLLDGDVLIIQFWKSGLRSHVNGKHKSLKLEVPKGVSITVNSVSADVSADKLDGALVNVISVSGSIDFGEIKATTLDLQSVSGKISARTVECETLKVETVSGDMKFGVNSCKVLTGESVSGTLALTLNGMGANVNFSSVSGKCKNNSNSEGAENKCQIDFETVSGDLRID